MLTHLPSLTRGRAPNRTCQATDSTGCLPGNPDHIGSMEVDVSPVSDTQNGSGAF